MISPEKLLSGDNKRNKYFCNICKCPKFMEN